MVEPSSPRLVAPPSGHRAAWSEPIAFEWQPIEADTIFSKIGLFVGCEPEKPEHDPEGARRVFIHTPDQPWKRFVESPARLGLPAGRQFYWRVGQDAGEGWELSEVRALFVEAEPTSFAASLSIRYRVPPWIRLGSELVIPVPVTNPTDRPIRLTYCGPARHRLRIWATRGILDDRLVWDSGRPAFAPIESQDIPPQSTILQEVRWNPAPGTNRVGTGRYRLEITSLARERPGRIDAEFSIR